MMINRRCGTENRRISAFDYFLLRSLFERNDHV